MKKAGFLVFAGIGLLLFSLYFACSLNLGASNNGKGNAPGITIPRAFGDRITVSGTQFFAGSSRIWINGANTPWNSWDDMGGTMDTNWWNTEFQTLHTNGINATRVWLICSGDVGIVIDSSGYVSNATATFWNHLDSLMQICQNQQVYLDATLISFDCVKNNTASNWKNMFNSDSSIDSFVSNFLIPLVNRYKNNPWLWTIDLCNEPDWLFETYGIPWNRIQTYFAKCAVGIHANSSILVNVGMAIIKYNSTTCAGAQGNMVSDASLQALVGGDTRAKVDFWNVHYYPWMDPYWPVPFNVTPVVFGLDASKPSIVGECPAKDSTNHTIIGDYENAYQNGWQGVMPWTANGVDANGDITTLGPATLAFLGNHYSLVFPGGTNSSSSSLSSSSSTSTSLSASSASSAVSSSRSSAVSSTVSSISSAASSSSASAQYLNINLPFTNDGVGEYYWQTSGTITSMNSWNLDALDVNGTSFKNVYVSGSGLPAKQNGYYYIHYKGSYSYSHVEIAGSGTVSSSSVTSAASSSSSVSSAASSSLAASSAASSVTVSSSRSSAASSVAVSSSRSSVASSVAVSSSLAASSVASSAASSAGGYAVNYNVSNDWGAGATVTVTIKNNSAAALSSWSLVWTFAGNQAITQIWSASQTTSGETVTAVNLSYNGAIGANGGTLAFGFNLSYSGSNAKPTAFTLNGTACSTY